MQDPEDAFVSPLQGVVGPAGPHYHPGALQELRHEQHERAAAMLNAREEAREAFRARRGAPPTHNIERGIQRLIL
jgi:hypothetical protein